MPLSLPRPVGSDVEKTDEDDAQPIQSGATDEESGLEDHPGDGARADGELRAHAADLVDDPAHGVADSAEGRGAEGSAGVLIAPKHALPGADGVLMEDEAVGGVLDAPALHADDLEDLEAVLGEDVGTAVRIHVAEPMTEDGEPAFEECVAEKSGVALGREADNL